ncbi:UbiA family prenyltransferase [Candidatus Woesearchaeota archaeon]|nr:UbiA family prenyltransferase [Candidatus Woesearchaeota archaeon]
MHPYVAAVRPLNGIMAAIAVYIGSVVAGASLISGQDILVGMLSVFLISGGGMVANDIADIEIDKVNRPKRPLASGRMSKSAAYVYAAALMFVGNYLVFYFLSFSALYVSLAATLILIGYAAYLKRVVLLGNMMISLLVALTFIYGGVIFGEFTNVLPLALLAFLSNTGREIYKTIDDAMGDRRFNINTVAVKWGVTKARTAASFFILLAVLLSFVPYYIGIFNEVYLFFVLIADALFVATIIVPVKHASRLTKIAMIVALIAFLAGAYSVRI